MTLDWSKSAVKVKKRKKETTKCSSRELEMKRMERTFMIFGINSFLVFFFLCKKDKFLLLIQHQERQKIAKIHIGSPGYLD